MGVFHEIERSLARGEAVHCLYLTSGAWGRVRPEERNAESAGVLTKLGVPRENIFFPGTSQGIPDGRLADHIPAAWAELDRLLDALVPVGRLVTLAWEGGHQDHDAANWLTWKQAEKRGILKESRQFPLYRAARTRVLPYVVARPLPSAGAVEEEKIPLGRRLAYLRLCLSYATQRKTMLGLLPFLAIDYLISGRQKLLPLGVPQPDRRPHPGALLYERRKRFRFEDLASRLKSAS